MSQTHPGESFAVVPDALAALADELSTLAAELTGDVERIRSAAGWFPVALEGHEGWTAGAAATSWALLCDLVADRTRALGEVLTAAVTAYRAEDAALARSLGPGRTPR
ncbi:MAG TPA: hypothetical protein VGN28_06270 [Blastococcus sp.]|nr:hypothetical protein [Blastococcus sp.]